MMEENMFGDDSLLAASRQRWKVAIPIAGMLVSLGTMAAIQLHGSMADVHYYLLGASFTVLFAGMTYAFMSIRCPRCRRRYFWAIAKTADASEWLVVAARAKACPDCGYPSDDRRVAG